MLVFDRAEQRKSAECTSSRVVVQPGRVQEGVTREVPTRHQVIDRCWNAASASNVCDCIVLIPMKCFIKLRLESYRTGRSKPSTRSLLTLFVQRLCSLWTCLTHCVTAWSKDLVLIIVVYFKFYCHLCQLCWKRSSLQCDCSVSLSVGFVIHVNSCGGF